jgi:hypothetical protein
VKWVVLEDSRTYILAAAMHAGAAVVEVLRSSGDNAAEGAESAVGYSLGVYKMDHGLQALVYGIDAVGRYKQASGSGSAYSLTAASCSFYENTLHIWDITF